jgi:glycosyltransferase involved in cell wall biosynthesis
MQSQVKAQALALAERGHAVTIGVGGPVTSLRHPAVRTESLPAWNPRRPWPFWRAVRRLRRTVGADVVHGHPLRLAPVVAFAGARRAFVTCHGIDPERIPVRFLRVLRHLPVCVVACGPGPQRQLATRGVRAAQIDNISTPATVHHTRAELLQRFDLAPDAVVALYPARFTRQKGHDQLLDMLAALESTRLVVVAVGDGPLRDQIIGERDARGLTQRLQVAPWLDDAHGWMSATDLFITTARWEGQPLIALEALHHHLPMASCCPIGLEGLLRNGDNGVQVDTPEALARLVDQWIADPSQRPQNFAASETILRAHQPGVVAGALEALYAS